MKQYIMISILFLFCTGCTMIEMKKENQMTRERITIKESQLDELEREKEHLEYNKRNLSEALASKQMTLKQLNDELVALISQNKQLAEAAKAKQQDVMNLKKEISFLEKKQHEISQVETTDMSAKLKEEKIKFLQKDIRNYLLIGLKAKHRQNL